jgi:hypothetical protein
MANAPAVSPVDSIQPERFSKTTPLAHHPLQKLLPQQHGNPTRQFLDQDSYELTIGNKFVLPPLMTYSVLTTNTNVLTTRCWPKFKLPEGVQQVSGTEFNYNVVPATRVPKRGTVRFMSKQTSSFSLSITQKGIGSIYEGSALNTPYGPSLIAMDIRAYGESLDQAMALATAVNLVNTAFHAPFLKTGMTYARVLSQEMATELARWACIGSSGDRIADEIEELRRDLPSIDTILIPDKANKYIAPRGSVGIELPILTYSLDKNNEIVETESADRLMSSGQLFGGKVQVFDMTQFRIKNTGKSFQPLEAMNTIGEVYFMYGEENYHQAGFVHPNTWDIYVYDEPKDGFTKLTFRDALEACAIWGDSSSQPDFNKYDPRLVQLVRDYNAELLTNPSLKGGDTQIPISFDSSIPLSEQLSHDPLLAQRAAMARQGNPLSGAFYLPKFYGNLSQKYQDIKDIQRTVASAVARLTYATSSGEMRFADAQEQLANVRSLCEQWEGEVYKPAYWQEVVRLNLERSLAVDAQGRRYFQGTPTSEARRAAYGAPVQAEWTPNPRGGMDVPSDVRRFGLPAGMFSAAGLLTIANMPDHPDQENAELAYKFLNALVTKLRTIMHSSALFTTSEMPVNMPKDDPVEVALRALFGPRAPIYLAAPTSMIQAAAVDVQQPQASSQLREEALTTGSITVVGLTAGSLAAGARGEPTLFAQQDAGGVTHYYFTLSSGAIVETTQAAFNAAVAGKSPLAVNAILNSAVLGVQEIDDGVFGPEWETVLDPPVADAPRTQLASELRAYLAGRIYARLGSDDPANDAQYFTMIKLATYLFNQITPANAAVMREQVQALLHPRAKGKGKEDDDKLIAALRAAAEGLRVANNLVADNANRLKAILVSLSASPADQLSTALVIATDTLATDVGNVARSLPAGALSNYYVPIKGGAVPTYLAGGTKPLDAAAFLLAPLDLVPVADQQTYLKHLAEAQAAFAGAAAARGATIPAASSAKGRGLSANVGVGGLDLAGARYYRAPMHFSLTLLASSARHATPWILPGDATKQFHEPLARKQGTSELPAEQWRQLPHYVQSQASAAPVPTAWHDMGAYHRIATLSGAFGGVRSSSVSRSAVPSAQPGMFSGASVIEGESQQIFRSPGAMDDAHLSIHGSHAHGPLGQGHFAGPSTSYSQAGGVVPSQAFREIFRGPMLQHMAQIMALYEYQPVHRLAAMAFLHQPIQSLYVAQEMINAGIWLPLEIWAARPFSRHTMGSFLCMVSGLRSGANFYNGAKYTVAHDGDTDMYHTRAVLTTDAHAIRPENHRLLRNVQPRNYAGGHDGKWILRIEDLAPGKPLLSRPSVMSFLCPRRSHEHVRFPISTIDLVPGQIVSGQPDYIAPDMKAQHFPGADYYGGRVWREVFHDPTSVLQFQAATGPQAKTIEFSADSRTPNNLLFLGWHARCDPSSGKFTIEVAGNGHRAPRRFNFPGAKDYLGGQGGYLTLDPPPLASFGLS